MAEVAKIKVIKLGENSHELLPKYIQDTSGNAKVWQDIVDLASAAKLELKVVQSLPTASADTMHYIYLVPKTTALTQNVYDEFVTVRSGSAGSYTYAWESIGTTELELQNYLKKGITYSDAATSAGSHTHTVSVDATLPTVSKTSKNLAASASGTAVGVDGTADAITGFGTHTTDTALGEATTFSVSGGAATKTNISASASGTAVGVDGTAEAITGFGTHTTAAAITALGTATTADAITGFGDHTKDNALGEATTFSVSGGAATKTNVAATATGTAVGVDGTADAVTSYPGVTSKLQMSTVTGVSGTTNVPSSVSTTAGVAAAWSATVSDGGELSFSWTANTPTSVTVGDNVAVAQAASSASTIVTGIGSEGTGAEVLTGLGTAVTATVATGVKVTSQPSIALSTGATAGAGVISVATDVSAVSVSANKDDLVGAITGLGAATKATVITGFGAHTTANAITALGTPTTATVATGVKVTSQPSISLATGATAGAGVIEVATDVSAVSVSANTNDPVVAITALGTATKATVATGVKVTADPTITLDGDAATGTAYVSDVTIGTESKTLSGSAASAGSHTHDVLVSAS